MAREGLRTLVVSKKVLSEEQYQDFEVIKLNYTGKKCEFHTMKFAIAPLNPHSISVLFRYYIHTMAIYNYYG
jgi:hypothetical protein